MSPETEADGAATGPSGSLPGAGGTRLFYTRVGPDGTPTVVLHGGPGLHSAYLAPDLAPLSADLPLFFYDQRGGGRSEIDLPPAKLTARRHVEDLEAVRTFLGIDRLTLLGHSWGGLLAGLYATSHPDRVERIVLVGADPPAREPIWSRLDPTRGLLAEEVETLRELSDWPSATNPLEACRAFWRLALRPRFAAPERQAWMRGDVCDAPLDALVRASRAPHTRESLGAWDVRVELARVRAPVLVIHGEQDVTPVSAARAWATTLPEARILIVPDAGHFPHVERPDAFFPAVRTFLEGRWPEKARAT